MKKGITIGIVVLVVLGLAYYLFKISPSQDQAAQSGYNSLIVENTNAAQLSQPPPFDPTTDHYMGDPNAKNVFIEYGDLQCPYCAAYNPMLITVASSIPDTVFVYRYFPLLQHQNTVEAALANEAAGAQGQYWAFHDLLYTQQTNWQDLSDPLSTFVQYAQQVGVKDNNQFQTDITSHKYLATIQKDSDESYGLQLQGTPSYFFNGHPLQLVSDITSLEKEAEPYLNK